LCCLEGLAKNILIYLEGLAKNILLYLERLAKNILLYLEGLAKNIMLYLEGLDILYLKGLAMLYLERLAKSDVVLQRGILHPGLLSHIGHLALDVDLAGHAHPLHVPNEGGEKRGLARPHLSHNRHQFAPLHFQLYPLKN
jgi:hypothetical protein